MSDFSYGEFNWWFGSVVDIDDPLKLGRVKVNIYGYYDEISKSDLPWATTINPIQSASSNGNGISPTGLRVNSMVVGFFADGNNAQIPLVLGSIAGMPSDNDVNKMAREIKQTKKKSYSKGDLSHSGTSYSAKYPYNHTISGNGYLIEFDDTQGSERLSWEMSCGSWFEADNKGNMIYHSKDNMYFGIENDSITIIGNDKKVYVGGNSKIHVAGNAELKIDGDYTVKVGGNYDLNIGGNCNVTVSGNYNTNVAGEYIIKALNIRLN